MNNTINEGLDYHDMEGQISPNITVDEYAAKMGKDSDIVTLTFTVNSKQAGKDLVDWLETGYDWVLDASLSDGEIEIGKYLVFVEMNRRSSVPARIVELLVDLKTLTDIRLTEWTVEIDDEEYDADKDTLKQVIICNPGEYRSKKEKEKELNEMRELANLETESLYQEDQYIKDIKNMVGI